MANVAIHETLPPAADLIERATKMMLMSAHGTSSFADSNRMQRFWRDAHVASHHAITEWQVNLEIYGKALLGVQPNITPLI
jgi:alkylation response protein AidB-like acyl-CoA dehydrogenase